MRSFLIISSLIFYVVFSASAQIFSKDKFKWYQGEVQLTDGTIKKGEIATNLAANVVQVKVDSEGGKQYAYTSANVNYFKAFDDKAERERIFYSLPYTDEYNGHDGLLFFELIKDADDFALLSRYQFKKVENSGYQLTGPTIANIGGGAGRNLETSSNDPSFRQSRVEYTTFFFINKDGEILPYGEVKGYENEGSLVKINFRNTLDKNALREVLGEDYDACMQFAKNENLNVKKIKDLVVVMDYYDSLN